MSLTTTLYEIKLTFVIFVVCVVLISDLFTYVLSNLMVRFLDFLTPPASIQTDFQRFSLILDPFRPLLIITKNIKNINALCFSGKLSVF